MYLIKSVHWFRWLFLMSHLNFLIPCQAICSPHLQLFFSHGKPRSYPHSSVSHLCTSLYTLPTIQNSFFPPVFPPPFHSESFICRTTAYLPRFSVSDTTFLITPCRNSYSFLLTFIFDYESSRCPSLPLNPCNLSCSCLY